jgi:hypothetical protein
VLENIASLKRHHHGIAHKLFDREAVEELIEAEFPREVGEAYRALKPLAYKADLARYCIIYAMGGIYADISHFFARGLPFDGSRPVVFADAFLSSPWDTNNSVFAAPAGHDALARAIDLVCANVKRRYYGPTFLCPTGPALFGKAWASTTEVDDLTVGKSRAVTREVLSTMLPGLPLPKLVRVHCLLLGETVVAVKRKQRIGGLGDEWVASTDDYLAQWENRDIYEREVASPNSLQHQPDE